MRRDDPATDDASADDPYDRSDDGGSWFPSPALPYAWPLGLTDREADDPEPYGDPAERHPYDETLADRDEGSWLDEGVITVLLVAGVALFVFPEPATSALGMVLIATGLVVWLYDLVTLED